MAVPQWTQNSGYKLATLQERVPLLLRYLLLQVQLVAQGLTQVLQKSAFLHNQEYQIQQLLPLQKLGHKTVSK